MNPVNTSRNRAVALLYDRNTTPCVTAKGDDELAERIIAVAKDHNIPIREEPEMVQLLSEVALGDEIPEVLYVAVAEVLSFAYLLKNKTPGNNKY